MRFSPALPPILLCALLFCLVWTPSAAPGPAALEVRARQQAEDAAQAARPENAADWQRLAAAFALARAQPDNAAAQQDFIKAFPTKPEAFAAVLHGDESAPGPDGESALLDRLLALAHAQDLGVRRMARRYLRALDPTRNIRAADKIYSAVSAWGCEDLLELAASPDPVVSVGALLLARDMAYAPRAEAALRSLRPDDGAEARLLKLAAIIDWNGATAYPELTLEFVRAFPGTPLGLARLLDFERALCRYDDSLTLGVLQRLAGDGPPGVKIPADAKWRAAQGADRKERPPTARPSAQKLAQALLPLYADADPGVSATAMLYSARLTSPGPLRAYLLKHADPAEPPYLKAIRAYCLARWSPADQARQQRFLRQFFINWDTFQRVILFEDFTALSARSPTLSWVCRLSLDPAGTSGDEIRREARDNLLAVHLALAQERKKSRLPDYKNQVDRLIFAAISSWN